MVTAGKDRGKTGKILRSFPKEMRILIEGVNLRSKRIRPKREGEKGQTIKLPVPMDISNTKLICPKCGKAVRVGYEIKDATKVRVCKKCHSPI